MRIVTKYICEICGNSFESIEQAQYCEDRGSPEGVWPIGTISMGEPGDLYDHRMAFALASSRVERHSLYGTLWACRDTHYGDSLGENMCGGSNGWLPNEFRAEWLTRPPMIRLIDWLTSQKITVTVNVGGKPVPLGQLIDEAKP